MLAELRWGFVEAAADDLGKIILIAESGGYRYFLDRISGVAEQIHRLLEAETDQVFSRRKTKVASNEAVQGGAVNVHFFGDFGDSGIRLLKMLLDQFAELLDGLIFTCSGVESRNGKNLITGGSGTVFTVEAEVVKAEAPSAE